MTCPHDSDEMWKATDAGMCPLCQKTEIKWLRAVVTRAKDALLDGQSTQWVHDLLVAALEPKP